MWKRKLWPLLVLTAAVLLSGCHMGGPSEAKIGYLPEADTLVPYLVAEEHYGENRLLLRRDALTEQLPFGSADIAYYPESTVDAFLGNEFLSRFPTRLQEQICDTEIEVCCRFPDNGRTETIRRKIFLLSATEAGIDMDIVTREGEPLDFFRDRSRHEILADDGARTGWWLRSTYTSDRGLAWHIQANGTLGGRTVWQPSGIRPALCLSRETELVWREELGGYVPAGA